jgi:hypothetical protein
LGGYLTPLEEKNYDPETGSIMLLRIVRKPYAVGLTYLYKTMKAKLDFPFWSKII